jgi:D-alanyl-lipoteichoic acid acyltransferase DltB (MBOAT superfamily)
MRVLVLFNSPLYGVFLVAAFVVFWALQNARSARSLFLIAASYGFYFYGTWDTARGQKVPLGVWGWSVLCLSIIFVGSTLDYWIGRALEKTESPHARRALLLASVVYYLGVLAVFKYWNFAADSFAEVASALHLSVKPAHLRLVLPFGISFFTFETMSYTIDVYRRELPACRRYMDYLLFVCFFPHLVAGPIVRPRQMLPQLAATPAVDDDEQGRGLFLIAQGLAKKLLIGDFLAVAIVGRVFDAPKLYSSVEVVIGVYAYAFQIYADFSGYTDVALGSALLFGYKLPPNFDAPYTATSLQDFWRRWHISLSSWLRDYLYIPLGGSRGGPIFTYRNLMITMLLGGLWHGASWNFVIWGGLHGVALAGTRIWQRRFGDGAPRGLARGAATFLTFHYVCFAWIFFRAPTFAHARLVLERIAHLSWGTANLSPQIFAVLAVALATHWVPDGWLGRVREGFARTPALVQGIVLALCALALHAAATTAAQPFVYGQF